VLTHSKGIGLSVFGAVLQEIFYFKPQTIFVSIVFLSVLAYILGEAMASFIPRWGPVGRFLNPGPFHLKEHASIALMASAATQTALATEALAAQDLYYGGYPSKAAGIFIVLSSQLIGFGIAGLLRDVLVYPTHMVWPVNIPITSLLESFHGDRQVAKQRLKFFYIVFGVMIVWELFPQYLFPVLEGVSIFCLAKQDSLIFTSLFGGASGNEGMGLFAISFDWLFIASTGSPLWWPITTLANSYVGYMAGIALMMGIYYSNAFQSLDFPFMAQSLFNGSSNGTNYIVYNQTLVLNNAFEIDPAAVAQEGTPFLTGTYLAYLITTNMAFTATLVHLLLWNYNDLKAGWSWASPSNLRKFLSISSWKFWVNQETPEERYTRKQNDPTLDPHYKLMMRNLYKEVPTWWWFAVLVACWITGIVCLYVMRSTLPWWGFILSTLFTMVFILFYGAQNGITGFGFNLQPICQTLAGYLFPGRPLASRCS
jgi:OPT family oligopeptide transporter